MTEFHFLLGTAFIIASVVAFAELYDMFGKR